jgi:predicted dehydrogenase
MDVLRKYGDLFDVAGVAEPDEGHAKRLDAEKAYAGIPRLTAEQVAADASIEAVLIGSAVRDQAALALTFAKAGKHVHLEKPGGASHPAFRAITDACEKHGRVLQLGYMFRNNPAFEFCRRAVREGWLGTVYEVNGVIGKVASPALRKESGEFAGGTMFELGSHLLDGVVALLGKPERVTAHARRLRPEADDLADNMLAVLEYPKALATIRSSYLDVEGSDRRQLVVCGDAGAITIRPLEPPTLMLTLSAVRGEYRNGRQPVPLPPMPGRYDGQLTDFARIVRGEKPQEYPIAHELAVHETVLRASGMALE